MTKRESQILAWIKENPMISQKEIAERANITRASVGVHISNLMKKGRIVGKQYILRDDKYVCVVGGANIDLTGTPKYSLTANDSIPGKTTMSLGGVGRNIAENLSKLGIKVELMTVLGSDSYSNEIQSNCRENNISIMHSQIIPSKRTSTYLCLTDEKGEMQYAVSDMDIYEHLTVGYIRDKINMLNNAAACVVDTNIPKETVEYIMDNCRAPIFLDTVSNKKAEKIADVIRNVYTIKPNINEAEVLSGIPIRTDDDLDIVSDKLMSKGIQNIFISMGERGVYYANRDGSGIMSSCKNVDVVNTTGAGDTFMSALVWAYVNDFDIRSSAKAGLAAAAICISDEATVNREISADKVHDMIKKEWR